jgi:hypothetical protein
MTYFPYTLTFDIDTNHQRLCLSPVHFEGLEAARVAMAAAVMPAV